VDGGSHASCWGYGGRGVLGSGALNDRAAPYAITSIAIYNAIAVSDHACARTTTSALFCWGADGNYQVGDARRWTRPRRWDHAERRRLAVGLRHRARRRWPSRRRRSAGGERFASPARRPARRSRARTWTGGRGSSFAPRRVDVLIGHGGIVECFGRNASGELGRNTFTRRGDPQAVDGG